MKKGYMFIQTPISSYAFMLIKADKNLQPDEKLE